MSQTPDDLLTHRSEYAPPVSEIGVEWESWDPVEGVVTHAGMLIAEDLDFFAAPPPEIGEIRTADSTLKTTKRPLSLFTRAAIIFGVPPAGIFGLRLAGFTGIDATILQIFFGIFWVPLAWFFTIFSHQCSFVGEDGVARVKCRGQRHKISKREIFCFESASELRTSQTRSYHNGVYSGTSYVFTWTGPDGRKAFKLSGSYMGENKPPKPKSKFHFALSAEINWSDWLLDRAQEELERQGSIRFRLDRENYVSVGPGFIELGTKGTVDRYEIGDIEGISVVDGTFKIKRKGAKEGWFRSEGVLQFSYGTMANARVFILALDRLTGLYVDA